MKAFFATTTYPARRLWAGLVAFLIAVGSGHYYASDEEKMYDTTLRMWQAIQHLFNPTVPVDMPILTEYGPMQSLLALFTTVRDVFDMARTKRNASLAHATS
ncbi:MAG: hypothetical protein EBS29_04740 [Chloroflexia bacterium]|nr:hypothetical protein [Chloroflexia bacterium]